MLKHIKTSSFKVRFYFLFLIQAVLENLLLFYR